MDLFEKLNELNLSLQGQSTNVFKLKSQKKLSIWKLKVENNFVAMFSFIEEFLANNDVELNIIKPLVVDHLSNLWKQLEKSFLPELDNTKLDWIQNPFAVQQQIPEHLSLKSQEELAEVSPDSKLLLEFPEKKLYSFWLSVKTEFPSLSDSAVTALLPFCLDVFVRVGVFDIGGNQNKLPFQPKQH